MSLRCDHRVLQFDRIRAATDGRMIPIHYCRRFNEPCTTAIPAAEGHRCCKVCPEKTSGPPRKTVAADVPCVHLGDPTGEKVECKTCAGRVKLKVYSCEVHGTCTIKTRHDGASGCCAGCKEYQRPEARTPPAPLRVVPIGSGGLETQPGGYAFNGGLFRWQGKLLCCYRTGWAGAKLHVAELNEDYSVIRTIPVKMPYHPRCSYGREDPRLFEFGGRLHVSFTGVQGAGRKGVVTNVLYARLTDKYQVEDLFYPPLRPRMGWEKNWAFFQHGKDLYCVYSISPHRVVRAHGIAPAEFAYEQPFRFPWSGGHLRGGASPVRVGDRFYHWFHGRKDPGAIYNVGVYVFEAEPPFRPIAASAEPLLAGDPKQTDGNYCPVTFPCGAVLENGIWRIGMGINDRRLAAAEWDATTIDEYLGVKS